MTRRSAIVHVGLEKTGSTAIQKWLDVHAEALNAAGVLMPRSIGFPNHTKLVAACLDNGATDHIKAYNLFASGLSEKRFRESIFSALDREISQADPQWRSLVITSELISSRLATEAEIKRLFDRISPYVDEIHVLIFLRRQDQLALSRFSSILRSGYSEFDNLFVNYSPFNFTSIPEGRALDDDLFFYDFEAILARFAAVPGVRLHVHAYGQSSPVEVMLRLLQLEVQPKRQGSERHNSALSAEAQFVLARLNRDHPVHFPSGMRNEAYRQLQRRVEREVKGLPRTIARHDARRFLQRYEAINQRVSDQYAGGRPLFSADFDRYPEAVDYSEFPSLLSDQLTHYQGFASLLPVREPRRARWSYRLRRLKASASTLLNAGA
mgnify:CR=1 FL=1